MDKELLKLKLVELVNDFKSNYQNYKKELEANTETKLVEPLFELLGWTKKDFVKQQEAHRGEKRGHADYAFYINEKIVFFLEVKKVGIPLDREADKQVISYALSKRVPFAVSTNFERLKVFCVEQENAVKNVFRTFEKPEDYVDNIQDLLFLSKDSFEQNLTLKKAESENRLKRRISIDKYLLEDLMHIRSLIATDLEKTYPKKYELNEKEEIIQRIIDRLIFIRRCEDIGINPDNIKIEELRHLPQNKTYPRLKEIFKKYNDVYNSGLFVIAKDNDCDAVEVNGKIIQDLAYLLYESRDKEYIYNFDWIDADVLGQVYEQYLGKILAQTKSGEAKLKDGQAHRKEQGIYYTPTYIVDYIVKNTVGELLKDKKIKAKDIKILDPACGSGSFLIKAFDYMQQHLTDGKEAVQHRLDFQTKNAPTYSVKTEILKNNLYGVDLDNKAVEITKLNLLLKAAEKNRKLPEEVDMHIRNGNSLIDDESIAGLNAFKWVGDFKEGSFDVVIGNPPYIRSQFLDDSNKSIFEKNYISAKKQYDIYILFIEKAVNLLKDEGLLGFIVPNKFLVSDYGFELRKIILKETNIIQIIDVSNLDVFKGVGTYPVILLLKKGNSDPKNKIKIKNNVTSQDYLINNKNFDLISQEDFINNDKNLFVTSSTKEYGGLIKKITNNSVNLGKIAEVFRGIIPENQKEYILSLEDYNKLNKPDKDNCKKALRARDVSNFNHRWNGEYFFYHKKINLNRSKPFEKQKIIMPRTVLKLKASYDDNGYTLIDRFYYIRTKNKEFEDKYLLALLNSDLITFYYRKLFGATHLQGNYLDLKGIDLEKIPIRVPSLKQKEDTTKLVDKMLLLNKRINDISDKQTSETVKIKQEIEKINKEIDELVYKLYGLTKDEINIVENSLKS